MSEHLQRLRITFARDAAARYITHLDVMRMWERALKRAALPVQYSQGFTPRPRIALAAPLAVGMTSQCELLEIRCAERIPLRRPLQSLSPQLPPGFRILDLREVPAGHPSLQSMLRAATYEITLSDDRPPQAWAAAIDDLLARETLPWEHQRGDETRRYDLRRLIFSLALLRAGSGEVVLQAELRNDETGSGRPEQVARALGLEAEPLRVHRTALRLEEPRLARAAYRAGGRDAD